MCGITGIIAIDQQGIGKINHFLKVMNNLQHHRGPDGEGFWIHAKKKVGFAHSRLSIIDLKDGGQPMVDSFGNVISYNGEIYNYLELKEELKREYSFKTKSDTEVILAAYKKWDADCVNHLRGMFAFAIWDESRQRLFCARDHFGIKPFYYATLNGIFYFASEAKALLPFVKSIETDINALRDYLVFQLCLDGKTLFKDILELPPAHCLLISKGNVKINHYWEIYYDLDFNHTPNYFAEKLKFSIEDSVKVHTRSDVAIGAYASGGIDSSIVASLAANFNQKEQFKIFHGRFNHGIKYDESYYANELALANDMKLHKTDITSKNFIDSIRSVIYHLDYPVAGPGSFPQYHVSKLAAKYRKVALGGQGGDEIFGGYTRYLIAYFEQCIKAAIDGNLRNGNFIVTYESIIPNLVCLKNYKPLLQEFWQQDLFGEMDARYYRLINRAPSMKNEINWNELGKYSPYETYKKIFNGKNVGKESYFDKMTHFDFKTLLPALLHVEDRMSMAHGLESRVPFLDRNLVEFAATIPANIKFKDGMLKKVLIDAMRSSLPTAILERKDKMGFPVPLNEWLRDELKDFIYEIFNTAKERPYFNKKEIIKSIGKESQFGRKIWGLLSLEIWHQEFHDKEYKFKQLLKNQEASK